MTRFLVVGDATLDVTVAPARPVRGGGDVPAVIRLGPGGQGANVAVRLARRGASVTLASAVASDAPGRLLAESLAAEGVTLRAVSAPRSALVVALLDAGGERSMLSDRQSLAAGELGAALGDADWVHVSAYALLDDEAGDALAGILAERPAGTRLSVAGGSVPPEPAQVARFRARVGVAQPDLLIFSRDEAAAMLGMPQLARRAVAELSVLAPVVIVTAGDQGSVAALDGDLHEVPPASAGGPVLDATGSGDAYLAAVLLGLAGGEWPPLVANLLAAMRAGSHAGALAARVVGAQGRTPDETPVGRP